MEQPQEEQKTVLNSLVCELMPLDRDAQIRVMRSVAAFFGIEEDLQ